MDKLVNEFRLVSRELFNNHFLEEILASEDWDFHEQFTLIEEQLFFALVTMRSEISKITYGLPQPDILVSSRFEKVCGIPIMLNREIDSGYWDHPVKQADPDCVFTFVRFFDWDQRSYQDSRYVRVIVKDWPANPALVGKHALIETDSISYGKA